MPKRLPSLDTTGDESSRTYGGKNAATTMVQKLENVKPSEASSSQSNPQGYAAVSQTIAYLESRNSESETHADRDEIKVSPRVSYRVAQIES